MVEGRYLSREDVLRMLLMFAMAGSSTSHGLWLSRGVQQEHREQNLEPCATCFCEMLKLSDIRLRCNGCDLQQRKMLYSKDEFKNQVHMNLRRGGLQVYVRKEQVREA